MHENRNNQTFRKYDAWRYRLQKAAVCTSLAVFMGGILSLYGLSSGSVPFLDLSDTCYASDNTVPEDFGALMAQLQAEVSAYYTVKDIIFFGDSRVVGMKGVGGEGYHYVGKTSAGYNWMSGRGYEKLQDKMNEFPEAAVVFCFGVNDLQHIDAYISWYQDFLLNNPGKRVYFLSVNPVVEGLAGENGYNVYDNDQIDPFNEKLSEAFPDQYLDSFDYLTYEGIGSGDGVHYSWETYWDVQEFVKEEIQERVAEEAE